MHQVFDLLFHLRLVRGIADDQVQVSIAEMPIGLRAVQAVRAQLRVDVFEPRRHRGDGQADVEAGEWRCCGRGFAG